MTLAAALMIAALPAGYSPTPAPAPERPIPMEQMTDSALTRRMAEGALHRVEGVWRFPADGGRVSVERVATTDGSVHYVMAVVAVGNRMLRPGTIIGHLWPTSKPDTFRARLYTSCNSADGTLSRPQNFTVTLAGEDSRLELRHVRKGVRLNWWRLLPYMFRFVLTPVDETPRNLDGCVRELPEPAIPANPRYL